MPSESPPPAHAGSNVPVYSVSELSGALKRTIEHLPGRSHERMAREASNPSNSGI